MENKRHLYDNLPVVIAGVCATMFMALCNTHHIHFQEQEQLFVFDTAYIADVMSVPGGLADLLGRFCTQFFIFSWVGAMVIGALLALIQYSLQTITHRLSGSSDQMGWLSGLMLVPSGILLAFMCDENALLGPVWAVFIALLAACGFTRIKNVKVSCALAIAGSMAMYWLVGPLALIYVALTSVALLRSNSSTMVKGGVAVALALFAIQPMLARHIVAIGLERLLYGVHYYRNPAVNASLPWVAAITTIAIPVIAGFCKKMDWKRHTALYSNLAVATILAILIGRFWYNPEAEKVLKYDFMSRFQQWDNIVETASAEAPNNAFCTTVLNLALAQKGRMTEQMFDYYQDGISGLIPEFQRDAISPLATAEVFYYLGMTNSAQRFVFEAQEAIPDFQKSGRCYKRLAETNLINGDYDVARKYLGALQKTWYYRKWATETLSHLSDETAINSHKEYGYLRLIKNDEDFFFSDRDLTQMLGKLFMSNKRNRLAFEYLEAACLLQCDLDMFIQCFGMNTDIQYPVFPSLYQQAVMLWWARDHNASDGLPNGVRKDIVSRFNMFFATMQHKPVDYDKLQQEFGKTYWYYYFTNKKDETQGI